MDTSECHIWGCDKYRVRSKLPREYAGKIITELAFNANKSFGYYFDKSKDCTIVVGVNKPDDLPLVGIIWEDLGVYN